MAGTSPLPVPLLHLALAFSVLAGCTAAPEDVTPTSGGGEPAAQTPAGVLPANAVELYAYDGAVTGAAAPDMWASGGMRGADPARVDVFEVPEGMLELVFAWEDPVGTGVGRVEVYRPDGKMVSSSRTTVGAGPPEASVAAVFWETGFEYAEDVLPGTHEVRYYVAGTMMAKLTVAGIPAG